MLLSLALDQVANELREQARGRGLTLSLSVPGEPIWLDADSVRLQQIVSNLLQNAIKFTSEGGHIWLSASAPVVRDGLGRRLVPISVRDDGVGISPDALARVFDLFMQEDRSLDRTRSGLGIGLTLVRRLVELHGGHVEARSEGLGKGSEFMVWLPVTSAPRGKSTTKGGPIESLAARKGRLRILVVDDNRDSAETLATLLALGGHDVRVEHDGPTGLATARAWPPNLVFLDIGLPGMDGMEVARRMRTEPALASVGIVALTGYGSPEIRRAAAEAGIDDYLTKPLDPDALESLIGPSVA